MYLQGQSSRLEIGAPESEHIIRVQDVSTDEEEREHSYARGYEKKIGNLMDEVGALKSEVCSFKIRGLNFDMLSKLMCTENLMFLLICLDLEMSCNAKK